MDLFDIKSNLIIKAIGYRVGSIDNFKMDKSNNFLLNNNGYINKNIFTTGWASSPSVGVIGTNKGEALETVKTILSIIHHKKNSTEKLKEEINKNNLNYITKNEWETINQREEDNAMPNFVREKFSDINIVFKNIK